MGLLKRSKFFRNENQEMVLQLIRTPLGVTNYNRIFSLMGRWQKRRCGSAVLSTGKSPKSDIFFIFTLQFEVLNNSIPKMRES